MSTRLAALTVAIAPGDRQSRARPLTAAGHGGVHRNRGGSRTDRHRRGVLNQMIPNVLIALAPLVRAARVILHPKLAPLQRRRRHGVGRLARVLRALGTVPGIRRLKPHPKSPRIPDSALTAYPLALIAPLLHRLSPHFRTAQGPFTGSPATLQAIPNPQTGNPRREGRKQT